MARRPGWLGIRAAVVLTTLVALLSFVIGVANISATSVTGPLAGVIPPSIQRAAGFTGALTGFLMLASALGLRRGLRVAWYSTVVLLPMTAIQGLVQANVTLAGRSLPLSAPLVVLSLLSLPTVLLNYRRFDREMELTTTQLAALSALIGAQVYAAAGAWALRDQFGGIATPTDAVYYAIITSSTVGYGDATPVSQTARLFGMSVVVLGVASFTVALGTLLGPAIEARFARALGNMNDTRLELLENHVVVLGHGDLTEPIIEELNDADATFVVVTDDQARAQELRTRDVEVLTADPSDEEPLRRVGIEDARAAVAATESDANDALAVLTARELHPDLRIVAAATDRENVAKLRRAGADAVISPAVIGGHLLVESALGSGDVEGFADRLTGPERG